MNLKKLRELANSVDATRAFKDLVTAQIEFESEVTPEFLIALIDLVELQHEAIKNMVPVFGDGLKIMQKAQEAYAAFNKEQ